MQIFKKYKCIIFLIMTFLITSGTTCVPTDTKSNPDPVEERYLVSGSVRNIQNLTVPGVLVRAFDYIQDADPRLLGETSTNENGYYTIFYMNSGEQVDLFVDCYNADGTLLSRSDVLLNAPRNARIDLILP